MGLFNLDGERFADMNLSDYTLRVELYRRIEGEEWEGDLVRALEYTPQEAAMKLLDPADNEEHRDMWHVVDDVNHRVVCDLDRDCHLLPIANRGIY